MRSNEIGMRKKITHQQLAMIAKLLVFLKSCLFIPISTYLEQVLAIVKGPYLATCSDYRRTVCGPDAFPQSSLTKTTLRQYYRIFLGNFKQKLSDTFQHLRAQSILKQGFYCITSDAPPTTFKVFTKVRPAAFAEITKTPLVPAVTGILKPVTIQLEIAPIARSPV